MIKRCIVSLAISLLVLPSLQAQRTLSLEECRRLAIDNNKTLAQSFRSMVFAQDNEVNEITAQESAVVTATGAR